MTHVLVTKCRFENNLEAARLAGQVTTDTSGRITEKYIGKYLIKGDITSTPVEEAVTRQTVPLVHNNLDAARLTGLDTDMARHINEKYIVKHAMKRDSSK